MPPKRLKRKTQKAESSKSVTPEPDKPPPEPEPERFNPTQVKEFEKMRTSIQTNLVKYSKCLLPTISQFQQPNLDNNQMNNLKVHILHDRKRTIDEFFRGEKESERKARELHEQKNNYHSDLAQREKVYQQISRLRQRRNEKQDKKHMLFTELKKAINSENESQPVTQNLMVGSNPALNRPNQKTGSVYSYGGGSVLSSMTPPGRKVLTQSSVLGMGTSSAPAGKMPVQPSFQNERT